MASLTLTAAVSILIELAARPGETRPSEMLATSRRMDGGTTRRLLQRLAQAALVRVRRGPGGGCVLARPAEEINLFDVAAAVGAPASRTAPLRASQVASRRRNLGPLVGEILAAADQCRDDFLGRVTIHELAVRLGRLDRESARQAARDRRRLVESAEAGVGCDGRDRRFRSGLSAR